jgi:CSLREA domain-containing protein
MRAGRLAALPVGLIVSLVMTASAGADTVAVNTVDDQNGTDPECSLREAITSQNSGTESGGCDLVTAAGTDTITFDSSITGVDIVLGNGQLVINDPNPAGIEIIGPGADQLAINGDGGSRVFTVESGITTSISGLTVTGGAAAASDNPANTVQGGGIRNRGDLTLTNVVVEENAAEIDSAAASTNVFAAGGGIFNTGSLTLDQSVVAGNFAGASNSAGDAGGAFARGGGISTEGGSSLTLEASTLSGNSGEATNDGGGEANATGGMHAGGNFHLVQSTVNGSTATAVAGSGGTTRTSGAIYAGGFTSSTIELSTVAENRESGGVSASTGGINSDATSLAIAGSTIALNGPESGAANGANLRGPATTTLINTILADPRGDGANCNGGMTSGGFNVDFSPAGESCFAAPMETDLTTDPMLSGNELNDNGGPTETIALDSISPAIDKGSNAGVTQGPSDEDQRQQTRPVDFSGLSNASGGDGTDIGAYEVQPGCAGQPDPDIECGQTVEVNTELDQDDSDPECSLREAMISQDDSTDIGGCELVPVLGTDTITFAATVSDIQLTEGALVIDHAAPLDVVGPGMNQLTITAAEESRVLEVVGDVPDTVTISGLTVTGGNPDPDVASVQGGGIFNEGDLELDDVRVSANQISAVSDTDDAIALGGGIYSEEFGESTRLTLVDSIVFGNTASATGTATGGTTQAVAAGAGVYNGGELVLIDSTVRENDAISTSDDDGTASAAGGVASGGPPGASFLGAFGSTFSENSGTVTMNGTGSAFALGGVGTGGDQDLMELSTVAENTADATGPAAGELIEAGGIAVQLGELEIHSSTIAHNGPSGAADLDGANLLVHGRFDPNAAASLANTIVSGPEGGGENCAAAEGGEITSGGFNVDFSPAGASCFAAPMGTDLTTNPLLSDDGLADNGGPTDTIALQAASPAIDKGSNEALEEAPSDEDQRGFPSPVLFTGIPDAPGGNGTDIGAYEFQLDCAGQALPDGACPGGGGGGGGNPPAPPPPAGSTGQRAKALKKCRKIKPKGDEQKAKKRKKCVKRARRLPV